MRPLYLEMENIGPFVKRTKVDLENIEEGGLFLISGPTGSGKSFIFDTICYALYGKTPSRREGNLRSDHSGVGDRPLIRFSFELGDRTFLVERILEYEDRKRGGGTIMRSEDASMIQLVKDPSSPGGLRSVPLATKKTDVHDRCVEILGLGIEQFSRVMMIPQGEFRELLRAETKDRESLLRRLFDSIFYLKVGDELSARYGRLKDRINASQERNRTIIDGIVTEMGLETKPGEGLTFEEWSKDVICKIETDLAGSRSKEMALRKTWDDSREQLRRSTEVYGTSRDLNSARQKMRELEDAGKDRICGYEKALDLSLRASRLRPDLRSHDDLASEKAGVEERVIELVSEMDVLKEQRSDLGEKEEKRVPDLEMDINEKEALKRNLESSVTAVSEVADIISELNAYNKKLKEKERIGSDLVKERSELEKKFIAIKEKILGLSVKEDISRLGIVIKNGEDLARIHKERGSIFSLIERSAGARAQLEDRIKIEMSGLSELRKGREASLASELAKGLEEGKECPVCGSLHHPAPRGPSDEDVSPEMISKKEDLIEEMRKELSRINEEHREHLTRKSELERRAGEIRSETEELSGVDEKDLDERLMELKVEESEVRKKAEAKVRLEGDLEKMTARRTEIESTHEPLLSEINDLNVKIASLDTKMNERSERMRELGIDLRKGDPKSDLADRIESIGERINELRTTVRSIKERSRKMDEELIKKGEKLSSERKRRDEIDKIVTRLTRTLSERISSIEGIGTIEDLRKAILEEDGESELKEAVKEYKDEISHLKNTIQDLDEKLRGSDMKIPEKEELDEMSARVEELEETWRSAHAAMSQLEGSLKRTMNNIDDIGRTKKIMKEEERLISIVGRMTGEVKGNMVPRISLERFFLAQRFEEVLISSNFRLKVLSGNRFFLKRASDEERGARSRGGLDINVFDNYTGQERPAHTLSGGQMFLCSLALALGLADVVQSRSGGIRMDALFIDEGFGSLDEETLQTALKVLSELREGRMVGVISHVGELKRQIRCGFEVVPSPSGSTVRSIQ
ncbi:MAG: AAA family ATPase [Candidatus Thermoplasmatota archaeon]|nr:AAA family ATPase [Candidatus Thermoplasmatota archaeon]